MSYRQGGQYTRTSSNHYQDQYAQYQPDQNGGYSTQQPPPPPPPQQQYPGQSTYSQQHAGGPVQQSQSGYQNNTVASPRAASYASSYAGSYQSPQTYNPQHYAQSPPQPQGQMPQYNPQSYVSMPSAPYPAQYNPSAYPEPPAQATSGPMGDPYAYSPSNHSSATFPSPQQPAYGHSPQRAQFGSPTQHFSPQPSQNQFSYQSRPSPPLSQPSYAFSNPAPTPQYAHIEMPYHENDRPPPLPQRHGSNAQENAWQPPLPRRHGSSAQLPSRQYTNISPGSLPGLSEGQYAPAPPYQSDTYQPPSPLHASMSHGSSPSPPGSTPGPTPPAHGAPSRANTLGRHPSQRPLPGIPGSEAEPDYFQHGRHMSREEAEALDQDELFDQVEDAILNAGRPGRSPSIALTSAPYDPNQSRQNFSAMSPRDGSGTNGHLSPIPSNAAIIDSYSDDSDPEAAAGLEAMRLAEERDAADDYRRQSGGSSQMPFTGYNSQPIPRRDSERSPASRQNGARTNNGDDYTGVDVSMFGGGYDVGSYGGDPSQLAAGGELNGDSHSQTMSSQHSSMRRSHPSQHSSYDYTMDNIHPFPPFRDARADVGGTGGNYEPPADGRRQSYDEGDEYALTEGQMPERFPDEPPDVFFNSASATYRPLPPPPPGEGPPTPHNEKNGFPYAPNGYDMNAQGQWVPRSASLINYSKTPPITQPLRSKTDAEERRLRQAHRVSAYSTYESTPASASAVAIDLPSLPTKRFVPAKLGTPDFKKCEQPWALSDILSWLVTVAKPDQTTELKESLIKEALVNLFTNKVPTMNIADAEVLSDRVVDNMYQAGALQKTEEWVKLSHVPMSGVIFQLSSAGCYSPTLHDHDVPGRCYSHFCQRTLKKVNLQTQPVRTNETWVEFYKLKKEDIEGKNHKEIERQNVLHEVVQTEDFYMEQLNLLRLIYRDPLARTEPSIISPKRKDKFLKDVFGKLEQVKQVNEDHLLPQLKYRQEEQGPWIVGFSDIFRQWIRMAKTAYIDYAGSFPGASFMVRQEMERNIQFAGFLDKARNDPRGKRLGWDTYLKSPITRLQRYSLLLNTVLKNMKTDSEEKTNLQIAYDEVKAVTLECDTRVAEMQRKVDLADLSAKLQLRPGMQSAVELNLLHLGRELVHRGDLQRMGGNRFTWLDSHALLFDHYLVIAKIDHARTEQGGRVEKYDVSRLPIPMDLLVLESTTDPAVQKSSYVRGITTVSTVSGRSSDQVTLGRTQSHSPAPGLASVNTGMSSSTLHTVTSIDNGKDSDKILYPIRLKHLGRESYNLFAPTEQARREWATKIIEAKTKHAKALYAQHAEPFKLRVMADSAFVYDGFAGVSNRTTVIKGTPIDRAIEEVELRFKDTGRPGPICRARVNCATNFTTPYPGKNMIAVGTDFGVFVSESDNPRGWTKAISMTRVTQVAVLEEFNLFLLISDKSLIAYHLDVVLAGPTTTADSSSRKAPQKLSGSRDVGFFVAGRMKDRTLVFYKKRDNLSSTFKVLEPIYQKSSERKRAVGYFKRATGSTEFFREFDDFYIPTECTGINLFTNSLAVSTARGFEVLSLERKVPQSVPETQGDSVQNIVRHIKDQRALCMLRLSEAEFLLCYANCAVYVNKHGEISRSVIMEFVGTAQTAALSGAYLVLFDTDFIEIRNAQNGRLKQIIAGREIKCLDDGGEYNAGLNRPSAPTGNGSAYGSTAQGGRTVKAVMQHPENERTQIVVELVLNGEMKEG